MLSEMAATTGGMSKPQSNSREPTPASGSMSGTVPACPIQPLREPLSRLRTAHRSCRYQVEPSPQSVETTLARDFTTEYQWCNEQNPQKVERIAQGPFLYSSEGREPLDVIYQRDGVITPAVEEEVVEARF